MAKARLSREDLLLNPPPFHPLERSGWGFWGAGVGCYCDFKARVVNARLFSQRSPNDGCNRKLYIYEYTRDTDEVTQYLFQFNSQKRVC